MKKYKTNVEGMLHENGKVKILQGDISSEKGGGRQSIQPCKQDGGN